MKKILLLVLAIAVASWGLGGCSSPSRVPVSLEPLNNWLLCHGPATLHYPYSCPPCPYCGSAQAVAETSPTDKQAGEPSSLRSEPAKKPLPADGDAKQ
jgi:hypothetical protein